MTVNLGGIELRAMQALWYAWGRKDAGAVVDALAFAEHYRRLYVASVSGRASSCPSVQSAFEAFLDSGPEVPPRVAS